MEDAEHPESLKERIPFYNGFDGTGWCHRNYSSGYYVNAVFGCIEILRILAGDIGKSMVVFTETRSCTRGLIGYTDPGVLSTLSENHDTKKESFEKYWSEVGDTVKTKAEAKIYDDVNSKLEDYWKIDEEIKNLGMNATDSDVQKQAEQRASAELTPAYNEIYKGMVSLMDKKVTEEMRSKPDWVCCRSLYLFLLS